MAAEPTPFDIAEFLAILEHPEVRAAILNMVKEEGGRDGCD